MYRTAKFLPPLVIAILVAAAFFPVLKSGFVYDDHYNLSDNVRYRGLSLSHLHWMFTTFHDENFHPLVWLSFGLDYTLWGMDAAGYHLTNLIIHICNGLMLYALVIKILRRANHLQEDTWESPLVLGAVAGTLFFALHPLRVEPVSWISARGDLLCAFFYILAILSYLHISSGGSNANRSKWIAFSLIFFTFSLLSRAWGITLPVVLIILDYYPLRRFGHHASERVALKNLIAEKTPFIILAIGGGGAAVMAKRVSMLVVSEYGILQRTMQAAYALCFYLWKTILPVGLYPYCLLDTGFDPLSIRYTFCFAAITAMTVALAAKATKCPWAISVWLSFAVIVSPLLGFAQVSTIFAADRYTYISCMPFALLVAGGMHHLLTATSTTSSAWSAAQKSGIVLAALVLVCYGIADHRQVRIWQDDHSLWSHTIRSDAGHYIAYNNRGSIYKDHQKNIQLALSDYSAAIALKPGFGRAYYNRALCHENLGNRASALADYTKTIELNPDFSKAYNNRGSLLLKEGDFAAAAADFNAAIRLSPESPYAYANRGVLRFLEDKRDMAAQDLRKAIEIAGPSWEGLGAAEDYLQKAVSLTK